MPESTQKTKKKFPRWILELFTFIFIPYLIVYISSPVIFGILLLIGIPIFIFLYFRLTNHIINSENPGGQKNLDLPQSPQTKKTPQSSRKIPPSSIARSSIVTLACTIFSWHIICSANEGNLLSSSALHTMLSKPYLVLIPCLLLITRPISILSALKFDDRHPNPLIELKCTTNQEGEASQGGGLKALISKHLSAVKYIFPTVIVFAFIFVLYHNKMVASGDLGLALQITSAQLPEQKSTWTTITITYLTIFYISFLPAIFLPHINSPKANQEIHRYVLLKAGSSKHIEPEKYYNYLTLLAAILTTISSFTTLYLLRITTIGDMTETFLFIVSLSMMACTFPISRIINKNLVENNQPDKEEKYDRRNTITLFAICTVVILISSWVLPNFFLEYMPRGIGGILANPGTTLESEESDYACIFPNDNKGKESITLGVVVESKPESIRIFTPEYNRNDNEYGKRIGGGKIKLNKLVETQIKISGGYRIEKFDGSKHGYNHQTGKCEYVQTRYSLKEIFYAEYIENSKKPPHK